MATIVSRVQPMSPKNALIRRPSDRKCKVVGTDTRTMRRYAYLQYYIKYCFIHLPTPCPSSTSPQLRSTFDAVSWDDFCQMGVQLYWKYHKRAFGKPNLRKSAQLTVSNAYLFGRSGANPPRRAKSRLKRNFPAVPSLRGFRLICPIAKT